jgi:hypothetical protein
MKKLLTFALFLVFCFSVKAAELIDVIQLKDSSVVRGHIIEQVPNVSITIKDLNNNLIKIDMSKVQKMMKVEYEDKTFYSKDYSEFGVSLVTPAGLNLNYVHWFSPYGIGISGMYWGDFYGIQGNFKFKLSDNRDRSHSLSLVAGRCYMSYQRTTPFTSYEENNLFDWKYIGATYNLNYSGFWLEVGITASEVKIEPKKEVNTFDGILPQLVFQIGYVYRFIK